MRVVGIIQARMASSRLPGKILADVCGRPLLERVVNRARRAVQLDEVVVATTDQPADDATAATNAALDVPCFRGSETDVLDRYLHAARAHRADVVVRLTADCPLLEPAVIDRVTTQLIDAGCDYASNTIDCTYPDGLDAEAMTLTALECAWREANRASQREHVTPFIRENPARFRLASVRSARDLSALRWTVDTPQDLEFVRAVYADLGPGDFDMHDVLRLLERRPELSEINSCQQRNEGYWKSLAHDHLVATPSG